MVTNAAELAPANTSDVDDVVVAAVARAHDWLEEGKESTSGSHATEQLAALVRDPNGVGFTMDFVDRVARPESNKVAANAMRKITEAPDFLGEFNKALLNLGSFFAPYFPWIVMPMARARMRQMVGHLVLDAGSHALNKRLEEANAEGVQLNLNLLGEEVLGEKEAKDRTRRTIELIRNPNVTYVSVKASSLCSQLNHRDYDGSLKRLKDRLRPVYEEAKKNGVFVNLDMEEYHDLDLTIDLFKEIISEDEFKDFEAGIVLQAYLPDTIYALKDLAEFAVKRVEEGGTPIKVRLVKGANISMERVEGEIKGWHQAPYMVKAETDANYFRLLDFILQPEYADAVHIGVGSHNLFTSALAWELATKRGVERQVNAEMLQGMAPAQARAVHEVYGELILYTPVVKPEDFDVAVSYLARRLEENSDRENFLYSLFAPATKGGNQLTPMEEQEELFYQAVNGRWSTFAGPARDQNRPEESGTQAADIQRFVNEPDSDPVFKHNRTWALKALAKEPGEVEHEEITDVDAVDEFVSRGVKLGEEWGKTSGEERAEVLHRLADALADARQDLLSVMAHEAGKTISESDPEVSEAIDFANYYGHSAAALDTGYTAKFHPRRLTVVVPPWNFPVAIPCGGMLAALAAGSAVIIKPAPQVVRCAEVAVAALRSGLEAAGQDPDLIQLVRADEGDAGRALVDHDDVDQVIFTGSSETAELFRGWDPKLNISAETSGKNALVVTASADPDLAVADLYQSAFGHSGQKCSAASLLILVGAEGESKRFIDQLVDAVKTLQVGPGTDIATTMNGLIEPPGEKLKRGLTQLDEGERWLIKPRQLDAEGRFWSPGIRDNVKPGSWFHKNECFGPVLGIMYAEDLDQAIEWQNSTGFGLTGGIHSLDNEEVAHWIERVEVGNAYVNKGITGAIVQRQSFGGWKQSVVGPGAKAGGPNYVAQFGDWEDQLPEPQNIDLSPNVREILSKYQVLDKDDQRWLWRAAESDAYAWRNEFGIDHDPTALRSEANIFRYKKLLEPLRVRVGENYRTRDVVRMLLGAAITDSELDVSAPPAVAAELNQLGVFARPVSNERFAVEIQRSPSTRVRTLGTVTDDLYEAAAASQSVVLDQPVLADGRRELLPFLLEQALSATMHRFGIIMPVGHIER